jgi:type II secretory pathway pseudopilin PulG
MRAPKTNRPAAFTWIEMMVVIVCVVLLAGFIILPAIARRYYKASHVNCVNNLKNIGLAWRIYATDNNGLYPWQAAVTNRPACVPTNYATVPGAALGPAQGVGAMFSMLSNELSIPKIFLCPSDAKRFQLKTNSFAFLMAPAQTLVRDRAISYFIGTSAKEDEPQSILGGDRNLAGGPFGTDPNTPPSQVALRIPYATATNVAAMNSAVWTQDIHQGAGNLLLGDGSFQQVSAGRMREQFRDAATNSGTDLDFIWPAN